MPQQKRTTRITIDLSSGDYTMLTKLVSLLGESTKVTVVRTALRTIDDIIHARSGDRVKIHTEKGTVIVQIVP